MVKREEDIAKNIKEAEAIKLEAEKEAESYRARNEEFENNRIEMMRVAQEEGENKKKSLIDNARTDVEHQKSRWLETVEREHEVFLQELKRRTSRQVMEIARKIIVDLTDKELQGQTVKTFILQLKLMSQDEKEEFRKAMGHSDGEKKIIINSAFSLNEHERDEINNAIQKYFSESIKPVYQTVPELVLGIEMRTSGWKYSWSVEHYLQNLDEEINRMIELKRKSGKNVSGTEK